MRRVLSSSFDDWHEHTFVNLIVHIAPANAVAPKSQQPDHKRCRVPNDNERHFLPESALLQSPNSDQPRYQRAEAQIGADVGETNCAWMSERDGQTPRQSLCKNEPQMSPWAHVPHHRHPAKPLDKKILQRIVVRNGLNGIRKQLDFKTLFRDQSANQKVIRGTIFDRLITPESGKVRARRDDRLSQHELDSIQLPRH